MAELNCPECDITHTAATCGQIPTPEHWIRWCEQTNSTYMGVNYGQQLIEHWVKGYIKGDAAIIEPNSAAAAFLRDFFAGKL